MYRAAHQMFKVFVCSFETCIKTTSAVFLTILCLNQMLLQLIHLLHCFLINTFLHDTPYPVIDSTDVETVAIHVVV